MRGRPLIRCPKHPDYWHDDDQPCRICRLEARVGELEAALKQKEGPR